MSVRGPSRQCRPMPTELPATGTFQFKMPLHLSGHEPEHSDSALVTQSADHDRNLPQSSAWILPAIH
jgi:hypothetical protein